MVSTAAECALRASTMSDEFFTKGTSPSGYTTAVGTLGIVNTASSRENTLRIDIGDGQNFQYKNLYLLAYNINQEGTLDGQTTVRKAYEAMFVNNSSFKKWASNVLTLQYVTPDVSITVADMIKGSDGQLTAPVAQYKIPKLCTMGAEMFANTSGVPNFESKVYKAMVDSYSGSAGVYGSNAKSLANGTSTESKVQAMLSSYDYWKYERTGSINGTEYFYYLTPTALGFTYIDTAVLDILYRSNLDLLMRGKYLFLRDDGLGDRYSSVIPYTYFPDDDTDFASTWANNVVNNGSFYYVRGSLKPRALNATAKAEYNYGWKPNVQYIYITLTPKDRDTLNKNATSYPNWLEATMTSGSKSAKYHECIDAMLSEAISPTTTLKTLAANYTGTGNYNIILAQATFASEFIIPYQSSPMRGMAEHFGSSDKRTGSYSEQDLNCFTITNSASTFTQNFGAMFGNNKVGQYMQTINSFVSTGKSMLQGNMPYVYTTYYAIAD